MNHETLEMNIDHIEAESQLILLRVGLKQVEGSAKKKNGLQIQGVASTCNIFGYQEKPQFISSEPKDSHVFSSVMPDSSSKI